MYYFCFIFLNLFELPFQVGQQAIYDRSQPLFTSRLRLPVKITKQKWILHNFL